MTDQCFPLDELDSLLDLSPGDPRWRHLADCPLCRARLAAYRAFLSEGPPLSRSHPERARVDLERFVETMVERGIEPRANKGFWTRLREYRPSRPRLVPALVAAAAAAVVLVVVLRPFPDGDRTRAPLRGTGPSSPDRAVVQAQPPVFQDGAVAFSWSPLPEADRYVVALFDARLDEIARFDAGRDTSIRVATADIPRPEGLLLWRVVAYRAGEEYARSSLVPLDLGGH